MNIRTVLLILLFVPVIILGGVVLAKVPMNAAFVAILGALMIFLAYKFYARRIDRDVIQPDTKRATPAKLYMDGVDFMPTGRNVLFGDRWPPPRFGDGCPRCSG
jgi:carbon starvation protein